MVRLRITKTMHGSPDGRRVLLYSHGEEYEMEDSLAEVFLREGWAVPVISGSCSDFSDSSALSSSVSVDVDVVKSVSSPPVTKSAVRSPVRSRGRPRRS